MREVDEGEARCLVINGENLLVEGIAGVGKTHFVQSLVQELRALGKSVASYRRRTWPRSALAAVPRTTGFADTCCTGARRPR